MQIFILDTDIRIEENGHGYTASTRRNTFRGWGWTEEQAKEALKEKIQESI